MGVGRRIRVHYFITTEESALLAETETEGLLHPPVIINQKDWKHDLYLECSFETEYIQCHIILGKYFNGIRLYILSILSITHICSLSSTAFLLRIGLERYKEAGFLGDKDERVPGAQAK